MAPGLQLPQVGPIVVFVCQLLYLMPNYYLFNALILVGRKDEEWAMHNTLLQTELASVALEMLWSAAHPEALHSAVCAAASLVYAALQGVNLALACSAPSGAYGYGTAFGLQLLAGLALIPVRQVGNNFTLRERVSPARYRILAWLASVLLAVANLLTQRMASPWVLVPCATLPAVAMAALLLWGSPAACGRSAGNSSVEALHGDPAPALSRVSWLRAGAFAVLGCALGTTGESMMDMAATLAVRRRLKEGSRDLALTNQCSIFASMSLAYASETRAGGGAAKRGGLFILVWMACQLLRGFSLHLLEDGALGMPLLAVFVFMDKYTGPLGAAALDVALLKVLQVSCPEGGAPSTLLWTARMVISRVERPACKLVLLHASEVPVERVAFCFSLATCAGVLAILWSSPGRGEAGGAAKKDN